MNLQLLLWADALVRTSAVGAVAWTNVDSGPRERIAPALAVASRQKRAPGQRIEEVMSCTPS
jgi:hypothetical protein